MTLTSPNVYSITPCVSFADALVKKILDDYGNDPQSLARVTLLLPTRRACRTVREAFLRLSNGKAMLLPRMHPLGDLDEDELTLSGWKEIGGLNAVKPAISPLRRQLLLTRLILSAATNQNTRTDQAAQLAGELAQLLDQVHTEGLSFEKLKDLVPEDYATHWNITLDFLKILTEHWPLILDSEGCIDPAERRNRLLNAQRLIWQNSPPRHPIIAAGSTASIPAVADLLALIATLDNGLVILPGLDLHMAEDDWQNLDANHPQYGLKQLLKRLKLDPRDVKELDSDFLEGAHPLRAKLLSEAMLPAKTSEKWRNLAEPPSGLLDGIERIDCPTSFEEARIIALLMRKELETPHNTASLVTPDRNLARRVASELRRWNIEIDDSAGLPLHHSPSGMFLKLLASCVRDEFSPVSFLALCKHPFCAAGLDATIFRRRLRQLELLILHGPRPASNLEGLRSALQLKEQDWRRQTGRLNSARRKILDEQYELLDQIETCLAPFIKVMKRKKTGLNKLIESHIKACELLASTSLENGVEKLWSNESGEACALFINEMLECTHDFDEIDPDDYPALFETLMKNRAVRPRFGAHPRLSILGLFEARLHKADLVIMSGLNEGTWPPDPKATPWMSRPMMQKFGLPAAEFIIGQTAHDFCQNFCSKRVVITRSERVDGTPTVRSRWLRRLENRLSQTEYKDRFLAHSPWISKQAALDYVAKVKPVAPPAPRPPLHARPRALYVTRIEKWMRDPYSIYARNILGIKQLDPIDADPSRADYGNIIHQILEIFIQQNPKFIPDNAEEKLLQIGRDVFGNGIENPGIWAFWWPKFERIAKWFIDEEKTRRYLIEKSFTELEGSITFESEGGKFTLSAKADRLDLYKDGTLNIIDYKTGSPPNEKEIIAGYSPQMPLEACIAHAGGFKEFGPRDIKNIEFWRLKGTVPAGEIKAPVKDIEKIMEDALDGVKALVRTFDRIETPYTARPNPDEKLNKYSEYGHLARVKEWSSAGSEDE